MKSKRKTYIYVLIDMSNMRNKTDKRGRPLLTDHKLPFYWNVRVAKERCSQFKNVKVKRVELYKLMETVHAGETIMFNL